MLVPGIFSLIDPIAYFKKPYDIFSILVKNTITKRIFIPQNASPEQLADYLWQEINSLI